MSTLHRKLPEVISLIDEVDTIIIDRPILSNGRIQPSAIQQEQNELGFSEFKITHEMADGNKTARLTSTDDNNHQNMNFVVTDNTDKILLDSSYAKRRCSRKILNVCSPAGFFLGSVRERLFKNKADYEIHTANATALYLVTVDQANRAITITPKNRGHIIAKVSPSFRAGVKVRFTITYLENISALHKLPILCAVVSCFEKSNAYQFTYNICNTLQNWICCPLFRFSKVGYVILFIVYPVIIALYISILLFYLVLNLGTCGIVHLILSIHEIDDYLFDWPSMLCGCYDHSFYFGEYVIPV